MKNVYLLSLACILAFSFSAKSQIIDPSFNPGSGFNAEVASLALQTDGKILVGGSFVSFNGITDISRLARLHNDGSLDTSFKSKGFAATAFPRINAIAVQADGKILAGGN